MEYTFRKENREYLRIQAKLPVRYRFLTEQRTGPELKLVYDGRTENVSGGGILLQGRIPDEGWVPDLLCERVIIGLEILFPDKQEPVRALGRVAWLETKDPRTMDCHIGIKFREITRRDQDRLFQFVIENQFV
jgi:c-di-GMP-binding flagellar brake protein YcgR